MDDLQNKPDISRAIGRLEGKVDLMVTSISNLASSFESLEKGRLSRLEIAFAELNTSVKDKARVTAIWTAGIMTIVTSIIILVITKFFKL